MSIPEEFIDRVKDQTNIVDIAREYLSLKRSGRTYKALCPFHADTHPSLHVSEDKQIFKCFVCGYGGNVFKLVMELEGMAFPDAVRQLADRLGWQLPESGAPGDQSRKKQLLAVNEKVTAYYHKTLLSRKGDDTRNYLKSRGIESEAIQSFRLGYADDAWDSTVRQLTGDEVACALELDLIRPRREGKGYIDRYRDRLVFPITDIHNKVIGFGARLLGPAQKGAAKYFNSSDSDLFNKSRTLYGLAQARRAIMDEDAAVIMEGYTDVILSHIHGIRHTVAALGTALTEEHGRILSRYTKRVILCLDPDPAGLAATVRGIYVLLGQRFEVQVAQLPDGQDPAEYVQAHGAAGLRKALASAQDFFHYHLGLLTDGSDSKTVRGKERVIKAILPTLAATAEPIRQGEYIRNLAEQLEVDERVVRTELAGCEKSQRPRPRQLRQALKTGTTGVSEQLLVKLVVAHPELWAAYREDIGALRWQDAVANEVISNYREPVSSILHDLSPEANNLVTAALLQEPTPRAEEELKDTIRSIQRRMVQEEIKKYTAQLNEHEASGNIAESKKTQEMIVKLQRFEHKLKGTEDEA